MAICASLGIANLDASVYGECEINSTELGVANLTYVREDSRYYYGLHADAVVFQT